mmetsp:Transcript_7065/g.18289  ORF Transcript_7065/g.18289 Transcript_7065/m.18289 type:complete len:117 (-) Transcript_7065:235-585(-)
MVAQVGAGATMQLGGTITEIMTALFAWKFPALLTFSSVVQGTASLETAADSEAASVSTASAACISDVSGGVGVKTLAGRSTGNDDAWQLNDAARAALELEQQQTQLAGPGDDKNDI